MIAQLTASICAYAATLEMLLGGAGGDEVRLRSAQIRETVKRETGIEVPV